MSTRKFTALILGAAISALAVSASAAPADAAYKAPLNAYGQPDLEGTWTNATLTQDGSSSVSSFTAGTAGVGSTTGSAVNNTTGVPTVRWADAYIQNEDWGGIHIGFGGTAGYLTTQQDLSGTANAGYVNISDTDGGFSFRQNGAALIPTGAFPKAGTAGAGALNVVLQEALTPAVKDLPERRFGGRVFRVGDKVTQIRNNYDKGANGVFNGTLGVVTAIDVVRAEREILQHVSSASDSAVRQDRDAPIQGFGDCRQDGRRRRQAIQVASAMGRDHERSARERDGRAEMPVGV